ncbi:MAG: GNAT family N-acetyltransferase [Thermoanaerobaculaceae bacterium]
MSEGALIRPYRADDGGAVRSLIRACYGDGGVSQGSFRHWHFGNAEAVQGMVVAEVDGVVVGMQPMEVGPHRFADRRLLAGVLTGVMVHPEWRRRGLFSRLIDACEKRAWELGAELVWTMPNEQSLRGFAKLGYTDPGKRRLLAWSPRPERLLARTLPAALASVAGWLARPLVRGRSGRNPRWQVEEVESLGASAAAVAASEFSRWPGLVQERSQAWLQWRFAGELGRCYRAFVASDGSGVGAWAVTTIESRLGLVAGYLVDLAARDEGAATAVGRASLAALAESDVDIVMAVVSSRHLARRCRRIGLTAVPRWISPKRFHTVFRVRADAAPGIRSVLSTIEGWHLTLADWDNI